MKKSNQSWVVVCLIAATVQFAAAAVIRLKSGAIDAYAFNSLDAREYFTIAKNLVDHGAFSQDVSAPFRPDTWRTPGYPFFLAAVIAVAGKSPTAIILAQQFLNFLNMALLFSIARRRMSDRRAAIVSLLFLFEPYHLYYSFWLMSATLQTTLVLLIWHVFERSTKPILLGLLCGALILTWPGAVLVTAAVFVLLFLRAWRELKASAGPMWFVPAAFTGALIATTGAWMFRTYMVAGAFALSHQSGIVLAYFKATEITLWREGKTADRYLETSLDPDHDQTPHRVWDSIDQSLRDEVSGADEINWRNLAQGNRTSLDSFQLSDELTRLAIRGILDDPVSAMACCLTRFGQILTFPLDLAIAPPNGVTVNRLRCALIGSPYALLMGWILYRLIRDRSRLTGVAFPAACTFALLLAVTPQTDPRFRVPMIPLLVFVALAPRNETTDDRQEARPEATKGAQDKKTKPC